MRVYVDSSAVLKRVIDEPESGALADALDQFHEDDAALVTSELATVEVGRALLRLAAQTGLLPRESVNAAHADAFAGLYEHEISGQVVALARRVRPHVLRSLDAIHLVTAMLVDADVLITYDDRLADAGRENGLAVSSPR